jgi:hypothetical protein
MIDSLQATFVFWEPQYATMPEAVQVTAASPRTARARRDNATLRDAQVIEYAILTDTVEMLLSDGRVLRIFCAGDNVDWSLDHGEGLSKVERLYTDTVELKLPRKSALWHPDQEIEQRRHIRGIRIAPLVTLVYLYFRTTPDLLFAQMVDGGGARRLYFAGD